MVVALPRVGGWHSQVFVNRDELLAFRRHTGVLCVDTGAHATSSHVCSSRAARARPPSPSASRDSHAARDGLPTVAALPPGSAGDFTEPLPRHRSQGYPASIVEPCARRPTPTRRRESGNDRGRHAAPRPVSGTATANSTSFASTSPAAAAAAAAIPA